MAQQPKDIDDFKVMLRQIYKENGGYLVFSLGAHIEKRIVDNFCGIDIGKKFQLTDKLTMDDWNKQYERMEELRPELFKAESNPANDYKWAGYFDFYKGTVAK